MTTTTLSEIRSHGPCENGFAKIRDHLGVSPADAKTHSEPFPVALLLDTNGLNDALWVTAHVAPKALIRFLIRRLDDGACSALKTLRTLGGDHSRQINVVETIAYLLRRRLAGEDVDGELLNAVADAADAAYTAGPVAVRPKPTPPAPCGSISRGGPSCACPTGAAGARARPYPCRPGRPGPPRMASAEAAMPDTTLRVLVACETSGIGRRAFAARGHDTWSCDLEPAEDGSNRHIVCDVRDGILHEGWDLLCVMHPPCTRLCRSGRRWMSGPGRWTPPRTLPRGRTLDSLRAEFEDGVAVFTACWQAPVDRVAIENPEMNDLAREVMPADLPAPQMVQPYWFGDGAYKKTGWYLRGLPELRPTNRLPEPARDSDEWRRWNRVHRLPPGPERTRLRSRSFPGMMAAAADQWGDYAMQKEIGS